MMPHEHITQEMRQCIRECSECHDACLEAIHYCLHTGGRRAEAHHIRLMEDCAQICETSKDFMLRGSDLHHETCRACAAVCERCAEDCARLEDGERMRACAETCGRCAEACRGMSA